MKKINITNISLDKPAFLDKKKVDTSLPKKPFSQFIKNQPEEKTPTRDIFIQPDKKKESDTLPLKPIPEEGMVGRQQVQKPTLPSQLLKTDEPDKKILSPQLDSAPLKVADKQLPEKIFTDYIKSKEDTPTLVVPSILMKPPEVIQAPTSTTQPGPVDNILSPQIIDKIVQQVRVGVNEVGNTEFQFDLKSDILGGLKLKVNSSQEGKISISFTTESIEAKNIIEANISNLEKSLQERGLPEVAVFVGSGGESGSRGEDKYPYQALSIEKSPHKPKEKGEMSPIPEAYTATDYTI